MNIKKLINNTAFSIWKKVSQKDILSHIGHCGKLNQIVK
jgi:hypothetical protein